MLAKLGKEGKTLTIVPIRNFTYFVEFPSNFVSSVCSLYHSSCFFLGFHRIRTTLGVSRFLCHSLLLFCRKYDILFPLLAAMNIWNVSPLLIFAILVILAGMSLEEVQRPPWRFTRPVKSCLVGGRLTVSTSIALCFVLQKETMLFRGANDNYK